MKTSTFMQKSLSLAERGRFTCAPNPMVGCVIVQRDEIVAEGYHHKAGSDHAEIVALKAAGEQARGATVYVTLEPCCHYGRTPPCVDAIIKAGVAEVVVACLDPNPKVAGQGIAALEAAGINVKLGELAVAAEHLNRVFFHYILKQRPYVFAKWALSLDGKTATHTQDSQWITGERAREHVHQLRQSVGAIIVGSGTIIADDPALTVRLPQIEHQPLRVLLDGRGRSPLTAKLFDLELADTVVMTTALCDKVWHHELVQRGVNVFVVGENQIDLSLMLENLAQRDISSVLIEGGATVQASFFAADLVQEIYAYLAPKIIGGADAPGAVAGLGIAQMKEADTWKILEVLNLDPDVLLIAEKSRV